MKSRSDQPAQQKRNISRLETLIFRFTSQKGHLDRAFQSQGVLGEGIIVEIGLGSGRTFDHLRKGLQGRKLFALDFAVETHPGCEPQVDQLVLGEVSETLPSFAGNHEGEAALIHLDIGSKDRERDQALYKALEVHLLRLLKPGGVLVTDRSLDCAELKALDPLPSDSDWPYFSYQKIDL